MSELSLSLPNSLHGQLKDAAKRDGVSMNQFITTAVAEKLAALATAEYLQERGERGDKERFAAVLAKVTNAEPEEDDQL